MLQSPTSYFDSSRETLPILQSLTSHVASSWETLHPCCRILHWMLTHQERFCPCYRVLHCMMPHHERLYPCCRVLLDSSRETPPILQSPTSHVYSSFQKERLYPCCRVLLYSSRETPPILQSPTSHVDSSFQKERLYPCCRVLHRMHVDSSRDSTMLLNLWGKHDIQVLSFFQQLRLQMISFSLCGPIVLVLNFWEKKILSIGPDTCPAN
jgi:hypothetical protein